MAGARRRSRRSEGRQPRPNRRRAVSRFAGAGGAAAGSRPAPRGGQDEATQSLGGLVERFQREARGVRSVGTLPVLVAFPDSGPGLYLAAALTAEGAAPTAAFTFKRAVK